MAKQIKPEHAVYLPKIVDPLKIPQELLPMEVLVDDRRSWLGFQIKSHSGGNYCHAMILYKAGYETALVASQDRKYRKVSIRGYMKDNIFLKFWYCPDMSQDKRKLFIKAIEEALEKGGGYDKLGIVGQFLYSIFRLPILKRINNPWKFFCSERDAGFWRKVCTVIIRLKPSPSDLNADFNKSEKMEPYGYYFQD